MSDQVGKPKDNFHMMRLMSSWYVNYYKGKEMSQTLTTHIHLSCVTRKPVLGVSDQVRHKPNLEILDTSRGGIVLYAQRKSFTAQLIYIFVLHRRISGFLMTRLIYCCLYLPTFTLVLSKTSTRGPMVM